MKIGIFLGYGPQVRLGKEGLGRYLGGLMKGFQQAGHTVVVACPLWLTQTLEDLMISFSIDRDQVRFITNRRDPPVWKAYQRMTRTKKRGGFRAQVKRLVREKILRTEKHLANAPNMPVLLLILLFNILLGLLLFIPAVLAIGCRLLLSLAATVFLKLYAKLEKLPEKLELDDWQLSVFLRMNDTVNEGLVSQINGGQDADVWFVPSIFWPQVLSIQAPTVINAPDLVSQEYPSRFADIYNSTNAIKRCRQVLQQGSRFITYCDFIREELLLKQYSKRPDQAIAIPHVNNAMDAYIAIDPAVRQQMNTEADLSLRFARSVVANLVPKSLSKAPVFPAHWDQVRYIFYASQIRPHKNILNLLKAFQDLRRNRGCVHKLYLTCDPDGMQEVRDYILHEGLEQDVLFFFNVPAQALAALYACADLVVNPTLYEGGFPFTFSEGMSVGTPSLMSRIPQTEDTLVQACLEEIMFDPYDWQDIAAKMEAWLPRLQELYQKELPLYKVFEQRTPDVVAREYVDAFQRLIAS